MMNKSVNAFTIVELLVVMILGAIVSALLYQAAIAVSTLSRDFEKRQREVQEIYFWYTTLYKDIAKAEKIEIKDDVMVMVDDEKTTTFKLTSDALVRQCEPAKDSLQLTDGKFLMTEVDSRALMYCTTLTFQYNGQSVRWEFYKKYSAAEALNKLIIP